ncbi:hypothetical protein AAMO2058_000093800 [Amorphochlora amoebiformis]
MIALCLAGASVIGLIVTYAWKVGATSYVVGSLDHLGPILIKNVARLPYFFEKGFGDMKRIDGEIEYLPGAFIDIPKVEQKNDSEERTFKSHYADRGLPLEAQTGRFCIVGNLQESKGIVIHFSATGDESYYTRKNRYAKPLYRNHKIASILLMCPYYAARKPSGQKMWSIRTVEDIVLQSNASISDGVSILRWLKNTYPDKPLGLTGVSYGASMACLTALKSVSHGIDVALCACVPADRPVFLDGVLRNVLSPEIKKAANKEKLRAIFNRMTVRKVSLLMQHQKKSKTQNDREISRKLAYVQISANHDKFIPSWSAEETYTIMGSPQNANVAELYNLSGGHGSVIALRAGFYVEKIARSFQLLKDA